MTNIDDQRLLVAGTLLELPYETWNFGDSVAFEGLLAASETVGDEQWARFAQGWARSWATRATPYRRLDCTAPGRAIVALAMRFDDDLLLKAATDLADYLLARPMIYGVYATWEHSPLMAPYGSAAMSDEHIALLADPPPGVFLDCLHFDPPFFLALGAGLEAPRYWRAGLTQAVGYVRLLQVDSGLFDHFVLDGVDGRFGPGWGRGQGWALLGLLDVIETARELPLDDADRAMVVDLEASARALSIEMMRIQREDGHWYAVVTDPESGDEFSTAAFMASGIARAVRMQIVSESEAGEAARRALEATRRSILDDGTLASVSVAVMACTEPSHYAHVPRGYRVPWGQGPAMIALCEHTEVP
jgi:unsaturated rhamnogalacturonyl hydrolase